MNARRPRASSQIPQPEGRCNDTDPMWIGDDGLLPLRPRRRVQPVLVRSRGRRTSSSSPSTTTSRSRPPRPARARSSTSRPGILCVFDPSRSKTPTRLKIGVAADLVETRPRFAERGEVRPRAPTSRRPASARCSSSAARSSPSPPRRATSAT